MLVGWSGCGGGRWMFVPFGANRWETQKLIQGERWVSLAEDDHREIQKPPRQCRGHLVVKRPLCPQQFLHRDGCGWSKGWL